ncbi:MAG: potassium channel protein [Pseudomonadota bacterium]
MEGNGTKGLQTSKIFYRLGFGLAFVVIGGTLGYGTLEGWSWFDALYMTIITITSIGFGEVHELSQAGRAFTILVIIVGFGVVAYSAVTVSRLLIEGEVEKILSRRQSMKQIEKIRNHYIVCGFGRMGSFVCRELHARGIPFVVIDREPEMQERIMQAGYFLSPGDATEEDVLIAANIATARGLVSVLDSDAANVYTVLSARELKPGLDIVARAGEESAKKKLLRAGANRVISPYQFGGFRIVMGILKPTVMSFLEVAMDHKELNIDLEEVLLSESSDYCGKTLVESGIRKDFNVVIVAVKKGDGRMEFNPGPETVMHGNDTLILMGEKKNMEALEKRAGEASEWHTKSAL